MNYKLFLRLLITLSFTPSADAQFPESERQVNRWAEIGRAAIEKNDLNTAIINFERVAKNTVDPCSAEYMAALASAAREAKKQPTLFLAMRDYRERAEVIDNAPQKPECDF